ncbi:PREDICTED: uncharacterized protein LOC106125005 isoform X1 [Papilio xuthus]|uniref:Uncharacterized protein LOC106125005 isoform X1 n=1 Tax=Papilio xuthus TaxID=66420 RepID=A0AAJ6ZQW6_PAPXU|nr:PREDICTED: uncharacterized protein LOC106125005 isoform X1 [Papilio xuthus]
MSTITLLSIICSIGFIAAAYLENESFMKPKLEKNKIVNKGVWIRKAGDDHPSKGGLGDFIFRESSLDADSLLRNNFDPFGENFMPDSVMVPNYIERTKRSAKDGHIRNKNTTDEKNTKSDKATFTKSKITSKFKPGKVFKDFPYDVAIMLTNNKRELIKSEGSSSKDVYDTREYNFSKIIPDLALSIDNLVKSESQITKNQNDTSTYQNTTIVIPKRSMQRDYESEIIKKIEFSEEMNKTEDSFESNKMDRNVFEGDDRAWHQTAPLPDVNAYKILPKTEETKPIKNKPMTEKGLVKVLSMLTKTFKKVMKQHNDIKRIHTKLTSINDEFMKNAQLLMTKFQDFDVKYLYLMKFNENLKDLEARLRSKEDFYNNKESELMKNLAEFENQQKKFLIQQQQFYNIQKLMLAQNEKINLKQNLIAKTQNEISLRQNNFARILKKAKQIYIDTKNTIPQKLSAMLTKPKDNNEVKNNDNDKPIVTTTSTQAPNTESVKINLFSVPSISRIVNYDNQLLKEKDDHPVDDLIYKYYFNNTYIDVLMKNKILSSFVPSPGNSFTRNAKNKRNERPRFVPKSTNLIPVNEIKPYNQVSKSPNLNRGKRWIKYSKKTGKRKHIGNDFNVVLKKEDMKLTNKTNISYKDRPFPKKIKNVPTKDPFMTMASSFCNEIGQNDNDQMLHWCIEKALRRLRAIEMKAARPIIVAEHTDVTSKATPTRNVPKNSEGVIMTTLFGAETTFTSTTSTTTEAPTSESSSTVSQEPTDSALFFPDNDQLETNLKQFEFNRDTEGTVYYDGSVHASQFEGPDSEGVSDLLPDMDSDSRVDIDPVALDLQQKRRAYVRRINEDIMRKMKQG